MQSSKKTHTNITIEIKQNLLRASKSVFVSFQNRAENRNNQFTRQNQSIRI